METSFNNDNTFSHVLDFHYLDDVINKEHRKGPKGRIARRYIASAQIIDLENEVIDIDALEREMPIMKDQGARINSQHTTMPTGEFFDWGRMVYKGIDAIWIDVEYYNAKPNQKENLRTLVN